MRANSIDIWLIILEIISVLGIVVNFAFVIYVRDMFDDSKSTVFFFFVLIFLLLKYYLSISSDDQGILMKKRNYAKTINLIHERGNTSNFIEPVNVYTDVDNVLYDEKKLERNFPKFKSPNFKFKKR